MMNRHSFISTLLTCLAAAALAVGLTAARALAQAQAGSIAGTVTDEAGRPIAAVEVSIASIGKRAATTSDGMYLLNAVPAGSYMVQARLIGYRPQTRSVTVSGGARATQDFALVSDPLNLATIVVTGTQTPRTKLETSNATTVLSPADITQASPRSTTEALRYVPGFTRVESSGGEVNENITMRGILGVEYVMFMEDGLPVFPTMHTFFMNADNLFRIDENVERMEVVRGAGSALFGSNTPGAIINLINKTGGPRVEGIVKAYGATGGLARTDFDVNGPVTDDWRFNVGGYYRYNRGVRDPGFPGTEGGQLKASLTRDFDNGYFRTSLKLINDRNQFILDLPFSGADNPQYVPGFSDFGSMNTNEGNNISVPTPDGQLTLPLDHGLRTKAYWLTASVGFDLGQGWNVSNSAQIMNNQQEWNAIVPFDVMTKDAAVNSYLTSYFGSYYGGVLRSNGTLPGTASVDSITLAGAPDYTLTYPNVRDINGAPMPYARANGLLAPGGEWHVAKPISAFQDQLTLKKDLGRGNGDNVALGLYFANYSQINNWYFTDILTDVADNPHFVDLAVNSANLVYHFTSPTSGADSSVTVALSNFAATQNGFRRFVSNYVNGEGQTTVGSGVIGGSVHLTDQLRLDLGVRGEFDSYVQTSQNTATVPVNGDTLNSMNLVNQDVWGVPSSYRHFSRTIRDWAGSLGLNYSLSDNTSLYALGSRAYKMPALDEFLNASAEQQVDLFKSKRNWTGEVGLKHVAHNIGVTLDGFYTVLKDIVSQGLVTDPNTGQPIWIIQTNPEVRSLGLEFEGAGRLPEEGLQLVTNWTLLRAEYASCPTGTGAVGCPTGADVGTLLSGVPPLVGNAALSYEAPAGLALDADWHFVDRRCTAAVGCATKLPTYSYFNFGAQYRIPANGITIRADLLNAFQSKGLEEGNPRLSLVGGATSSLYLARPILPRAFQVSMAYRF